MSFEVGEIHNGYELKEVLGGGGFGEVFVVEKKNETEKMVMKAIKLGMKGTEEFEQRSKLLNREITIGIKLGNTNKFLVHLKEFFMEKQYCCLIMEYCSGGDLEKILIKKKILSEKEILRLTYYVFNGLKTLHEENLIHRDLKPSNIYVCENGSYKLGDYGVAGALNPEGNTTIVGTPGYVAPEILNGEKYTSSVDVFSYGCILYRVLTGNHPFSNEKGTGINMSKLIMGKYEPISKSNYNEELINLCYRMLSLDPEKRPTVNEVLQNPLISCVEKEKEEEKIKTKLLEKENELLKEEIEKLVRKIKELEEEKNSDKKKIEQLEQAFEKLEKNKKVINNNNVEDDLEISFLKNPEDELNKIIIEKNKISFLKFNYDWSRFIDRKITEGIVKLEVIGTKPDLEGSPPHFIIGITTKEKLEYFSTHYLSTRKSSSCILGRCSPPLEIYPTTSEKLLDITCESGVKLVLELNMNEATLHYIVDDKPTYCVTNIPKGVYFGVSSGYYPVCFEVLSLKKLNKPSINPSMKFISVEWKY